MEASTMNPQVKAFFDKATWTLSYVVYDAPGGTAAIIDSVLDYDPKSGRTKTASADQLIEFVRSEKLTVDWILETHAHADHMSASQYLREQLGGRIGIGARITAVQETFKQVFNLEPAFAVDGSQFDRLFQEGERFAIGKLEAEMLFVPGHTPACGAYHIGDALFVGDTMFMPDVGTARCDFPGGDARTLYRSMRRLLEFPPSTRIFVCHDYPPAGRELRWETSVAEQREKNIHVHDGVSEEAFVEMRSARDRTLEMPMLILPAIQVNVRAGAFPPADDNGVRYLKIPLNAL
jgi:glyoxylase-like metal-dependent hydrolase (beta-lactamase superfamily II)